MHVLHGKKITKIRVHFAHHTFYSIAENARDNISSDPNSALISLIFSFNTIEAFINETISSRELFSGGRISKNEVKLYQGMKNMALGRKNNSSTLVKYKKAKRIFTKEVWNNKKSPYKEFFILQELRNAVVHRSPEVIKSEKLFRIEGQTFTVKYYRPEKQISELVKEGIINPIIGDDSWLECLKTKEFCDWCCQVAVDVINNFLNSLDEGRAKELMIDQMALECKNG
jgi:hypothetical protein